MMSLRFCCFYNQHFSFLCCLIALWFPYLGNLRIMVVFFNECLFVVVMNEIKDT